MPILESKVHQSATSKCLLAAGWGAILGFQACWLAECGFGASIPWHGLAWIVLSHMFLGFSIAATEGLMRWWKNGLLLGLALSIASAFGGEALGLRFVPNGIAAIAEGLADGLFLAFILKVLFPRTPPADEDCPCSSRLGNPHHAESEEYDRYLTYRRLTEEKACLEHLDAEREISRQPGFREDHRRADHLERTA